MIVEFLMVVISVKKRCSNAYVGNDAKAMLVNTLHTRPLACSHSHHVSRTQTGCLGVDQPLVLPGWLNG